MKNKEYNGKHQTAVEPPPLLTVSEWADKYRMLSGVATSESGQWHTSRTPYLHPKANLS